MYLISAPTNMSMAIQFPMCGIIYKSPYTKAYLGKGCVTFQMLKRGLGSLEIHRGSYEYISGARKSKSVNR